MDYEVDKVVDAVGLICPEPIMMLHAAVRDTQPGGIIKVNATDPASTRDIEHFCQFLGHKLLAKNSEGEKLIFYVKKGSDNA